MKESKAHLIKLKDKEGFLAFANDCCGISAEGETIEGAKYNLLCLAKDTEEFLG